MALSSRSCTQRLARLRLLRHEDLLPYHPRERSNGAKELYKTRGSRHDQVDLDCKQKLENRFVDALVQAGRCGRHKRGSPFQIRLPSSSNWRQEHGKKILWSTRSYSTAFEFGEAIQTPTEPDIQFSREDLQSLLTYYRRSDEPDTTFSPTRNPRKPLRTPTQSSSSCETSPNEPEVQRKEDHQTRAHVMELVEMISDLAATPEELFDLYRRLPPPRITYVPSSDRRAFLQRLSVVGKSSSTRSLKFLSVLDDMHAVGFKVSRKQWTSAIHLAGRAMPTVRWKEAESALRVWKEMEEGAGLRGDTVTFNVLLDIAIRAERLPLVEMILHEMAERQLSIDRFGHTAIICYHGIRQDGDAIRRAYKTLVSSGEVVDTLVLNAVMAALLRAGEASAADEVLHRMKDLHTRRTDIESPLLSPIHWEAPKDMTSTLHLLASDTHALDQNIPAAQSLAPDSHTYSIFLHHHANRTGELARVASLLDEMQRAGLPPRGRMYLDLLRGFFLHGGVRYSAWTAPRLESVWSSYLAVLDAGAPDVTAGRWIAIWAVRAFARCVGRERSLEVWAEMRCRWTPAQGDEEVVLGRVWELAASARE